jgi:hypothetical protein
MWELSDYGPVVKRAPITTGRVAPPSCEGDRMGPDVPVELYRLMQVGE